VDAAETVTDAVEQLQRQGYDVNFELDADGINCRACNHRHMPERLDVTHTFRFEGATNPSDEEIVLGVRCPDCSARGVIVSAYGPSAEPELFELLVRLTR
jgi:DNA-directed RNA polymerase subunit RPC12/RpoP